MISLSFINGEYENLPSSDDFCLLESVMQSISDDVDNSISSYLNIREDYMFESKIFGSLSDDKMLVLESGKDNVFKKIGEAIIEIFKKFQEAANKAIQRIKDIGFKTKTDTEKLNKLLKQRPELKDEIICAYKSGDLNVADARNIKELDKAFDEIIQMSKKKDVKPDTLRGKVEAMKKKFANPEDTTVVKAAKAATVVVTAATAVLTFKKLVLDARRDSDAYMKKKGITNEQLQKAIKDMAESHNKEDQELVSDALSKSQILKNAYIWLSKETGSYITKEQGKVEKLDKGITAFIAKHMKSESSTFVSNAVSGAKRAEKREDAEREKERIEKRKDADATAYAKMNAEMKYRKKHKMDIAQSKLDDAYYAQAGRVDYDYQDRTGKLSTKKLEAIDKAVQTNKPKSTKKDDDKKDKDNN